MFDMASDHSCCQQSTTVDSTRVLSTESDCHNLSLTILVCCTDNISGTIPKSEVKQKAGQLLFTETYTFFQ